MVITTEIKIHTTFPSHEKFPRGHLAINLPFILLTVQSLKCILSQWVIFRLSSERSHRKVYILYMAVSSDYLNLSIQVSFCVKLILIDRCLTNVYDKPQLFFKKKNIPFSDRHLCFFCLLTIENNFTSTLIQSLI